MLAAGKVASGTSLKYVPLEGEDWGYVEVREGAFMFWCVDVHCIIPLGIFS